ncbi:hypothetical protein [Arthrobacter sp. Z4-13]
MKPLLPKPHILAPAAALLLTTTLAGCGATPPPMDATSSRDKGSVQKAVRVMQVTSVHHATGMTLLEGPTFGPDGNLYLVDVTAPPGAGKVLRVDIEGETVSPVYTDDRSTDLGPIQSQERSPVRHRLPQWSGPQHEH